MTPELIKSIVNKADLRPVEKRQLFCYLAYFFTELTYEKIGAEINQCRTNAFYSVWAVKDRISTDKNFKSKIETLKTSLKSVS